MLERNMVHLNQNDIKTVFKIKLLYNWCCNQDIAHDSFQQFFAVKRIEVKELKLKLSVETIENLEKKDSHSGNKTN